VAGGLPDAHNAVANFDADAYPEIVAVAGGQVWLLEHTGRRQVGARWRFLAGDGRAATVADYAQRRASVDAAWPRASRYAVFETNGTLKWAAVTQDGSSNRTDPRLRFRGGRQAPKSSIGTS